MNENQLRYFISAAESRSFTKAAEEHYISQAAITLQIRTLEDSLGVQLFDRHSRPIQLTPAGAAFLREARIVLDQIDRAVARVQETSVGYSGTLHLGYTKGFERSRLPLVLRNFHDEFPNVLLAAHRKDDDILSSALRSREYDMVFTWDCTELCRSDSVDTCLVERSPLVAAMSERHPLSRRTRLRREELQGEPILMMTLSAGGDSSGDARFLSLYEDAGFRPEIVFRSNDAESILMMVAAEEGIAIIPSFVAKTSSIDEIKYIPLEGKNENVGVAAVWRKGDGNPLLGRFVDRLRSEMK